MIARKSFQMLSGAMLLSTLVMLNAVSVAIAQPLPQAKAPNPFINILTGGSGGVFYPLGSALSSIFAAKISGAPAARFTS